MTSATSNTPSRRRSRFGWLMVVIGAILLGLALGRDARLAFFGTRTEGEVTHIATRSSSRMVETREGFKRSYDHRTSVSYIMDVRYQPTEPGAQPVDFQTLATWGGPIDVGSKVPVVYNSSRAEIATTRQLWMPVLFGTLFGCLLLGGGVWLLRRS